MIINKVIRNKKEKGFSLIELIIVVSIIGIIAVIAIPNLMQARRASNEASAVSSVSLIYRSQITYKTTEGDGEYAELSDLQSGNYIDETLGSNMNIKSGYRFEVDIFPSSVGTYARFNLRSNPIIHSSINSITATGSKHFGTNETGGIYKTLDNSEVTFDDNTRLPDGTAIPLDDN